MWTVPPSSTHRTADITVRADGAIAAGGALGTLARYGVDRALAAPPLTFPWSTLWVNVTGSYLLGVVVVLVTERWPPARFVRPFAAIGFCGGFTTFSTIGGDRRRLLGRHGRAGLAAVACWSPWPPGSWPRRQAWAWPGSAPAPGRGPSPP